MLRGNSAGSGSMETLVEKMMNVLTHRGPDDDGIWVDTAGPVCLGHKRLSILDLSAQGHQPMSSLCGRFTVVYNGEIYNYRLLATELKALGYSFRGHSDTEVLLAAVCEWGVVDATRRFNGMFAFAIWDKQEKLLHLGRDRLGEKPLYYGWVGNDFVFASELKAFRALENFAAEIDLQALRLFFQYKYVPFPYSIYKGVYKLPPGTTAVIASGCRQDLPEPETYWSLYDDVVKKEQERRQTGEKENIDDLNKLLGDAVESRMVSDVSLGAFLSGGIDSSSVVALMQSRSTKPIQTFSIGFNESLFNEANYAKSVATKLGTEHTELYVTTEQAVDVIPALPDIYDEPFADCSQIPTYLVSQLARQKVTVALSGDGGDELFAGYWRHFMAEKIWRRASKIPMPFRQAIAATLTSLSPGTWDSLRSGADIFLPERRRNFPVGDRLFKLAGVLSADNEQAVYEFLVSEWQTNNSPLLETSQTAALRLPDGNLDKLNNLSELMMYLDSMTYLPGDILTKVDRASMAVSLEARIPFLDPAIIEFAWSLPENMKVRDGKGKWILRRLLAQYLPENLFERPKMGFGVPIDSWLRGPLRDWAEDLLRSEKLDRQGLLNSQLVRQRWSEHLSGRRNWQYQLWAVLMFQSWYARWMEV